ncbi:tetratricopeptide repeat protein [Termitidicoccus mucosus]|uniref:protein O-GlcNAc transferase n=1 Tax=Termitidicoccus mucosus TaxID=1184151 RepID=A0A178IHM8_9BACT|nr:hypothetical protein AW736_16215 [Opitutaceae bacterium TSB47]
MNSSSKIQTRINEAIAHVQHGQLARAEAILRQLAVGAPRLSLIADLAGQVASLQGKHVESIAHFRRALHLDLKSTPIAIRLAAALNSVQRFKEAESMLRQITQGTPGRADGWNALAHTLVMQGKLDEAVPFHERAVETDPKFPDGWYHYGLTLALLGQLSKALGCHERALAVDPSFVKARFGRAQCLHKLYRIEEALQDYDAFIKAQPSNLDARSYRLYALQNMDGIDPGMLFQEHVAYGKLLESSPAPAAPAPPVIKDRPLRLAILSPDLREHSCVYFIEPLLRHLDPARFELFLYHDHFCEDSFTARLKSLARVWRNFIGLPSQLIVQTIRTDRPDILIDLSGHIGMSIRLPLFARRLAPVQVTYLGYPDTTGLTTMDYRLTDAIADPPGDADRRHTEKLVRFSSTAWAYQPPATAPEPVPPPAASGRPITFGCFNNPVKFTDRMFAVWAELLAAIPDSRLLIKGRDLQDKDVRRRMLARMEKAGLPSTRIDMLDRTASTRSHLDLYAGIDIALDTFPYHGTTTTCEALWMGRPVVTLAGDRHAARVGCSLLAAIGHSEWIAETPADYVRIAARLASDHETLRQISTGLRDDMRRSALMDHPGQSARFADALAQCWEARLHAGEIEKYSSVS